MQECLRLFAAFFRIGAFTFGGGYAMLPMLQREVVEKHGWATEEDILDYYAVAQCTPGVIAVNAATFVGYKRRGWIGGLFATLGVISPGVIIIILISSLLKAFGGLTYVQYAFAGIRVAVCALILATVVKLWKKNIKGLRSVVLFIIALLITVLTDLSPVWLVVAAALTGILWPYLAPKKAGNDGDKEGKA